MLTNATVLICFGTRPEYIKVKSLIDNLSNIKTCFTGQHEQLLENVNVDYKLDMSQTISENRLNNIICNIMKHTNIFENIDYVLVQGDTTSAAAMALSAFNNGKKIIHLEAGLRSNDIKDPYPEEANRQLISRIADIHLCPTEFNKENLLKENVSGEIYVVGNTGLDNISKEGCEYGDQVLITMHRRDNHEKMDQWFQTMEAIAAKYDKLEFLIPLHPNPNVQKHRHLFQRVKVAEPMSHEDIVKYVKKCRFVISDSGGLQEECSYLNKKIIVCRKTTERPESVGVHSFMCEEPEKLEDLVDKIYEAYEVSAECPYGNGESWKNISGIINKPVFISLGKHCDVAYNIKRYTNGSITHFFDWIRNDFNAVLYILSQQNIDDILNIENIVYNDETSHLFLKTTSDKQMTLLFTHEEIIEPYEESIINFINKYKRRFYRLIDLIKSNKNICFIYHVISDVVTEDNIIEFENIFKNINNNINYSLCILVNSTTDYLCFCDDKYLQFNTNKYTINSTDNFSLWTNPHINWGYVFRTATKFINGVNIINLNDKILTQKDINYENINEKNINFTIIELLQNLFNKEFILFSSINNCLLNNKPLTLYQLMYFDDNIINIDAINNNNVFTLIKSINNNTWINLCYKKTDTFIELFKYKKTDNKLICECEYYKHNYLYNIIKYKDIRCYNNFKYLLPEIAQI